MKNRVHLIGFAMLLLIIGFAIGCGDPNRQLCKDACNALKHCDSAAEGGSDVLDEPWLISCEAGCDEADEINDIIAECVVNHKDDCENMNLDCQTGVF